ncbi:MAG: hypothetical protein DM484_18925 [Candidatus Methylumidiphilus alinenensis]|uniref:Uncharacterized protein n=1 Tax=Candidatus Methylumidiphilus alinenensis TaxID=2202197 RepID=A0A2W4R5L0_9GAMM|nr:MAG: hypothetical protein DM484_18925 [Candidatus Methylumidiphilus alinenensis]
MQSDIQPAAVQQAITAMGNSLELLSANYQSLFGQPASLDHCREAGRTLRCLIKRLADAVEAAISSGSQEVDYDLEEEESGDEAPTGKSVETDGPGEGFDDPLEM